LKRWWEAATIYQVYPRSYQDANGDGVGDLSGIRRRLDYIAGLGVDAIWLSPMFPSPMADFGYDVADYCGVDPLFGSLEEFDQLLQAAHHRGLKLLLDFVPNHSSDQHPWFIESRSSRSSPKRDWYIWRDPAPDGGPPNNWISDFGGSAWEYDETTGQYYYHAFLKAQADLNWRNPQVRQAMMDVMRFWLDRGVDGFRIDVLWHLLKAPGLPDNPPNPDYDPSMGEKLLVLQVNSTDQPDIHEIIAEMRHLADSYDGGAQRVLVGEVGLPLPKLMTYYGARADGVHLPFNFTLIDAPWNARGIADFIAAYEQALPPGAWPNWVMGSHDAHRIAGKIGEAQARVAALLLLTLRGTPTLYQGDEIGIGKVVLEAGQIVDPRELREPGLGFGRDPARTPMAWDGSAYGGFSDVKPWLPLHGDWRSRNVDAQSRDPDSMLNLYKRLLSLRRQYGALSTGDYTAVAAEGPVLAYRRTDADHDFFIALNMSGESQPCPDIPAGFQPVLTTLSGDLPHDLAALRPDEGLLLMRR
jgi:alpha-glucosidase